MQKVLLIANIGESSQSRIMIKNNLDHFSNHDDIAATIYDIKLGNASAKLENIDICLVCIGQDFEPSVSIQTLLCAIPIIKNVKPRMVIIETVIPVGTVGKFVKATAGEIPIAYSPNIIHRCRSLPFEAPRDSPRLLGANSREAAQVILPFLSLFYTHIYITETAEAAECATLLDLAKRAAIQAAINEFSANFSKDISMRDAIEGSNFIWTNYQNDHPSLGIKHNFASLIGGEEKFPLLTTAIEQLCLRPRFIFQDIVNRYCSGDLDKVHQKAFLIVGFGNQPGASEHDESPISEIAQMLTMEGAKVTIYDMFINRFSTINPPSIVYNSGRHIYDGILVMHPYLISLWKDYPHATFYCKVAS